MSRWVDAFNARDLDGMLSCMAADVELRPVRLTGLDASYRGHDGVREWFAQLERWRYDHRIILREARAVGEGEAFVSGSLSMDGESDVAPFCALHRIDGGAIVAARHYLSDPDLLAALGLIP